MKRFVVAAAVAAVVVPASASASTVVSCAKLKPGFGELCSFYGRYRYFQIWGTGPFRISTPSGHLADAVNRGNGWEAFVDQGKYYRGHAGVTNTGSRFVRFWSGQVW